MNISPRPAGWRVALNLETSTVTLHPVPASDYRYSGSVYRKAADVCDMLAERGVVASVSVEVGTVRIETTRPRDAERVAHAVEVLCGAKGAA